MTPMIYEIARIEIDPARAEAFEDAVAFCAPLFRSAKGCRSMALHRVIEDPARYRLVVGWDSVDDHMVTFRNSAAFQTWRETAGPSFVRPPVVEHVSVVRTHFGAGLGSDDTPSSETARR
jgi:quinol monooxygenase YgiN